jgi:trigger factor
LPEISEELAKKTGADSLDDLKEKIKANLERSSEMEVREGLRQQIEQLLLEKYPFDVPSSFVNREKKNRLDQRKHQLKKENYSEEEISGILEKEQEGVEKTVSDSIRLFFLSKKVADEKNITITKDELLRELMEEMFNPLSPIDRSLDPEEARSKVYINLSSRKVEEYLVDQAKIS